MSDKIEMELEEISNPLIRCIKAMKLKEKTPRISHKFIVPYLQKLPSLYNIIKTKENSEEIMLEISNRLIYQKLGKDKFVSRYGDKGDIFYIILQGKVAFLTVKPIKCYLNEEEYVMHLLKLRKNKETEILRQTLSINKNLFEINDNFDQWMKTNVSIYESNSSNLKRYSNEVYQTMIKVQKLIQIEDQSIELKITPEIYIQINKIANSELDPKKRKLITVYQYEHINTYESGQTFGYLALENKTSKRTATAITLTDCDLGLITKSDYEILIKEINDRFHKALSLLIYSYPLFDTISKKIFDHKYSHMFKYLKFTRGEVLFSEGEPIDCCCFLNKGEFEVSIKANLIELNEIISKLKKLKHPRNGNEELRENEEFDTNKPFTSPELQEVIFTRNVIKLGVIKDRDILGLMDNRKFGYSLFTVTCFSYGADVYKLANEAIKVLCTREQSVDYEINKFSNKKIDFYISRLQIQKNNINSLMAKKNYLKPETKVYLTPRNTFTEQNTQIKIKKIKKMKIKLPPIIETTRARMSCSEKEEALKILRGESEANKGKKYKRVNHKSALSIGNLFDEIQTKCLSRNREDILSDLVMNTKTFGNNRYISPLVEKKKKSTGQRVTNYALSPTGQVGFVDCLILDKVHRFMQKD